MNSNIHIVLIEPEIPQNTGNIGRTCVGLGAPLHLVGELGFSLDGRELKRAGLDYWDKLDVKKYSHWNDFEKKLPHNAQLVFVSKKGTKTIWEKQLKSPVFLVFGSESRGLPPSFYKRYQNDLTRIPQSENIRALNLATAVGIAGYEAARKLDIAFHPVKS